jgi:energy-coupling factor transporter ATP-binding protein EcfA2
LKDASEQRLQSISATEAPRIPWEKFRAGVFDWKAGEHVGLIGPTGLGKTTMLKAILPLHPFVVVFATKPRDSSMTQLIAERGYVRLDRWRSLDPEEYPRRVLWPDATQLGSHEVQKQVFHDAFERIYREGGWTVALDETWYLEQVLKLGGDIKVYLLQARSLDISLVAATQRPAWVPREIYTQCTHLMFWRTNDETDLQSISGIGWKSANTIKSLVANLDKYQVLYINTRTGFMCRTRAPKPN